MAFKLQGTAHLERVYGPRAWEELWTTARHDDTVMSIMDATRLYEAEIQSASKSLWAIYHVLQAAPAEEHSDLHALTKISLERILDTILALYLLPIESTKMHHICHGAPILRATHLQILNAVPSDHAALFMHKLDEFYQNSKDGVIKRPKLKAISSIVVNVQLTLHAFDFRRFDLVESCGLHLVPDDCYPSNLLEILSSALTRYRAKHHPVPQLTLNDLCIKYDKAIGQGSFAVVYEGSMKSRHVAVKVFREEVDRSTFEREVMAWAPLKASNLSPVLWSSEMARPFFAVMPYYIHGNMLDYVRSKRLSQREKLSLARGIISGLDYLHTLFQLCHGDLRAENILINAKGVAHLSDFGMAGSYIGASWMETEEGGNSQLKVQGPNRWMSPKRHQNGKVSKEDDVYAFGMTMWQLWTRTEPFMGIDEAYIKKLVVEGYRQSIPTGVSVPSQIWDMMNDCWDGLPVEVCGAVHIRDQLERCTDDAEFAN